LQDTAIRETIEELGITKDEIEMLGCFNTLTSHMGVIVNIFEKGRAIDTARCIAMRHYIDIVAKLHNRNIKLENRRIS
jgi:8-oxo-dGTP pyrophosphatase MutT (NUDIX family)